MYKASSYWHVYITGPSVKSNSQNKRLMIINTSAGPVSCYCLISKSLYYKCFDKLRVLILYLHKWLLDVYKCVKCHQYYCKRTQAQISIFPPHNYRVFLLCLLDFCRLNESFILSKYKDYYEIHELTEFMQQLGLCLASTSHAWSVNIFL